VSFLKKDRQHNRDTGNIHADTVDPFDLGIDVVKSRPELGTWNVHVEAAFAVSALNLRAVTVGAAHDRIDYGRWYYMVVQIDIHKSPHLIEQRVNQ
jgi:hypothetical protein